MHRTLSIGVLAGGLALILAACSGAATPAITASPTTAPTPTASPTQAPTTAPTLAPTSSTAAALATVVPFTSVPADLDGAIPAGIDPAVDCFPFTGTLPAGAVRAYNCTTSDVNLTYFQFDSSADLQKSYALSLAEDASVGGAGSGKTCSTGDWAGTWSATFRDGKKLGGPDFGLLCNAASTGDRAYIEQVDPTTNAMLVAELDVKTPFTSAELATARADLYAWWIGTTTMVSDEAKAN